MAPRKKTEDDPEVKEAEIIAPAVVEPLPDQTPDHLKNPNGDQEDK